MMGKKLKWLAVTLCIGIFAAMALGSGSSDSGKDKDIAGVNNAASDAGEVTVAEQILYDQSDIKITATGLGDSLFGTELKLLIENNSGKNITVQARNANVNGYMVSTMMSADVASGKKANDSLTFETSGLKECGIEKIAVMEFSFHIFDPETFDTIMDTDVITVKTSIADGYVQNYDDSGNVLVDSNGVKIIGKGLSASDSFWGPGLILYIENNSDRNITVQVRDVSVNGFMAASTMSEDVLVGKKAISAVQFFSTDLEENGITDITDVELYFHIFDMESWDGIFDSDVIKVTF